MALTKLGYIAQQHNVTNAEIVEAAGGVRHWRDNPTGLIHEIEGDILWAQSRGDADRIARLVDAYVAKRDAAKATPAPAAQSDQPMATERQIAFIRSLIDRGAHRQGGFVTVRATDDLSTLTRSQASAMIDSLTGRY